MSRRTDGDAIHHMAGLAADRCDMSKGSAADRRKHLCRSTSGPTRLGSTNPIRQIDMRSVHPGVFTQAAGWTDYRRWTDTNLWLHASALNLDARWIRQQKNYTKQ